jgi:hypothetical protein
MGIDYEEIKIMIEDCITRDRKLTSWEREFMQSLAEKTDGKNVTDRQVYILNKVWDRVT